MKTATKNKLATLFKNLYVPTKWEISQRIDLVLGEEGLELDSRFNPQNDEGSWNYNKIESGTDS